MFPLFATNIKNTSSTSSPVEKFATDVVVFSVVQTLTCEYIRECKKNQNDLLPVCYFPGPGER
jgi:hypothetical protein